MNISVHIQKIEHGNDLPLPAYESTLASGMDIRAALSEPIYLAPGERTLVPTGFKMAIPEGYEAQIRPRSGLAIKKGISLVNAPGTIDADYRGEVKIILINHGQDTFEIQHGERIAQMVITPVIQAEIIETDTLPETDRGDGGFGSTGV